MRGRNTILFSLLTVAVGLLFVADIAVGSVAIPLRDVAAALTSGETRRIAAQHNHRHTSD